VLVFYHFLVKRWEGVFCLVSRENDIPRIREFFFLLSLSVGFVLLCIIRYWAESTDYVCTCNIGCGVDIWKNPAYLSRWDLDLVCFSHNANECDCGS
jgi:hypothetical protein